MPSPEIPVSLSYTSFSVVCKSGQAELDHVVLGGDEYRMEKAN